MEQLLLMKIRGQLHFCESSHVYLPRKNDSIDIISVYVQMFVNLFKHM